MLSRINLGAPMLRSIGQVVCVAVVVALAVTALLGRGLGAAAQVPYPDLVGDVAIVAAATLLTSLRPLNPIGWLLVAFAVLGTVQNLAGVYGVRATRFGLPGGPLALSLGDSLWIPALFIPLTLLPVLYPDGRYPAPWWRWVNRSTVVGMLLATVVAGASATSARADVPLGRPIASLPPAIAVAVGTAAGILLGVATLLSVGGLFARIWRARSPQRQQMLWLVTTTLVAVPALFLTQGNWLFAVALALVPVAIVIGVLRYRLLGIELAIRRFLVYGLLTAIVVGIYAAVSAAVSMLVPSPVPIVVAAGAVAVALSPVRDRLQRIVDRLVYGARHDPLAAVRHVGAQVSALSLDPLLGVVDAVAASVRASYVAVRTPSGEILAATGDADAPRQSVRTLAVAGGHVADLVIAPAAGEPGLAAPDDRVIDALAVPVAVVVHAGRLNRELIAARARSAAATEVERARVRHDLHDGLGPSLSGVALGLEAVSMSLPTDVERAAQIVARMRTEVAYAVEEVRRIIEALGPGALEHGGLASALRDRAALATSASGVSVDLDLPAHMPDLAEDVVVAAYRIVDEALTNVLRHARARQCVISVVVGDTLAIEVRDDGQGWTRVRDGAIGLASMQRRAEAVGGTFAASGVAGGLVRVNLPLTAGIDDRQETR